MIFAAGIPLSLLLVVLLPDLGGLVFAYSGAVLLVILGDLAAAFPRRRLAVAVEVPERLFIGEASAVTARIAAARYARRVPLDFLCEQLGDLDPPEMRSAVLEPGLPAAIDLAIVPRRRGRVTIERIWIRWRGPLRLVQLTRLVPVDRVIDVLPNVHGVRSAALQFFAQEAIFGVKVQQQRGEGTEFDALRDYAPGLDHRFIDWKHSARHRKLLCKEFKTERNHEVVLAFDTGYLMVEPIDGMPRLDHAINAGLILAWISLQSGDLVGTYGFDAAIRHYAHPLRGLAAFSRIQRATAALDYHHDETNFTLGLAELAVRLRRRALVILFTDFVDTVTAELLIESMQRVALRHVVVFVALRDTLLQRVVDGSPEQFEDVAQAVVAHDLLRERSIVFERLERIGVHCLDVTSRGLSVALINRYLLIKQRGLI